MGLDPSCSTDTQRRPVGWRRRTDGAARCVRPAIAVLDELDSARRRAADCARRVEAATEPGRPARPRVLAITHQPAAAGCGRPRPRAGQGRSCLGWRSWPSSWKARLRRRRRRQLAGRPGDPGAIRPAIATPSATAGPTPRRPARLSPGSGPGPPGRDVEGQHGPGGLPWYWGTWWRGRRAPGSLLLAVDHAPGRQAHPRAGPVVVVVVDEERRPGRRSQPPQRGCLRLSVDGRPHRVAVDSETTGTSRVRPAVRVTVASVPTRAAATRSRMVRSSTGPP